MTLILEYRDKIKKFYRTNSVVILPILKFLMAFIALNGVNTLMGYMPRLDTLTIVLIASLACSFLPAGCLILLCMLFSLGHMYALSLEVLIVGVVFYLLMFLLLLRFAPSDSYVVILTPLFFAMKIPYVIPIAVGLLGNPLSAISVACGVIIYYVLHLIADCAPAVSAMEDNDVTGKVLYLVDSLLKNKAMLVIAASFAVTVIVVWAIRRMAVEHAWTIAMSAGAMVNLGMLLVGDLKYDIGLSLGAAIFGSLIAILAGKVIEFFRFCVDYGRTEHVQFEDDEYYYYVKAVPKMNVAAPTKTVKHINSNTQSMPALGEIQTRGADVRRADGRKAAGQTKASSREEQGRTGGRPSAGQSARGAESRTARPGSSQTRVASRTAQRVSQAQAEADFDRTESYATDEEMGQTKAMPLAWKGGQQGAGVRSADGLERSSRRSVAGVQPQRTAERRMPEMTSGSATYGEIADGASSNEDTSDDYEELF